LCSDPATGAGGLAGPGVCPSRKRCIGLRASRISGPVDRPVGVAPTSRQLVGPARHRVPRKVATLALCLTEETRVTLTALARSRTAPAHHVERSAIILHLADQRDATEIAAKLHIDRQRVTRCARRV